jgi:hypothetical protein
MKNIILPNRFCIKDRVNTHNYGVGFVVNGYLYVTQIMDGESNAFTYSIDTLSPSSVTSLDDNRTNAYHPSVPFLTSRHEAMKFGSEFNVSGRYTSYLELNKQFLGETADPEADPNNVMLVDYSRSLDWDSMLMESSVTEAMETMRSCLAPFLDCFERWA